MHDASLIQVEELRQKLGWSVVEMARFFDRTRATVYYWENGQARPRSNVRAVLRALAEACDRRRAYYLEREFEAWSQQVKETGLPGFLEVLATQPGCEQEVREELANRARSHDNVLLATSDGSPLACIVPLTESGLISLTRCLMTARKETRTSESSTPTSM